MSAAAAPQIEAACIPLDWQIAAASNAVKLANNSVSRPHVLTVMCCCLQCPDEFVVGYGLDFNEVQTWSLRFDALMCNDSDTFTTDGSSCAAPGDDTGWLEKSLVVQQAYRSLPYVGVLKPELYMNT
jgi:hypothetical protein